MDLDGVGAGFVSNGVDFVGIGREIELDGTNIVFTEWLIEFNGGICELSVLVYVDRKLFYDIKDSTANRPRLSIIMIVKFFADFV